MNVRAEGLRLGILSADRRPRGFGKEYPAQRSEKLLRFLLFVMLAVLAASGLLSLYQKALTHPYFEVREVNISGLERLSGKGLLAVLNPVLTGNIFTRDIKKAISLLNAQPWIESASVRRNFPDMIEAVIKERKPVAAVLLDRLYLVDAGGYLLEETVPEDGRLIISGFRHRLKVGQTIPDERFADALRMGEIISNDVFFKDHVEIVDLSYPEKVTVHLAKSGAILYFGPDRREWEEKFLEYLTVRKILSETGVPFESIDLSFKNRAVVVRKDDPAPIEKITFKGGMIDG
ncbi:MAG: FtsQ-type POTRA domain-containing protein [Nitrospinota bacterium]